MTTPDPRAVTDTDLASWVKLARPSDDDASHLVRIAAAVSSYVNGLPEQAADLTAPWSPDAQLGALMLGARLWRRRNSPSGVESFAEAGLSYVSRQDPDVARLLRLNAPRVG